MLNPQQVNAARAGLGIGYVPSPAASQPKNLSGNDLANHYLSLGKTQPTPSAPLPQDSADSTINATSVGNAAKDYGSGLMDTYSKAPGEIAGDVSKIADTFKSEKPGQIDSFGAMAKKSMALPNLFGDSLKTILAPMFQAVSTGVKTAGNALSDSPALQKFVADPNVSKALDYVNTKGDELNQIQKDHPEAAHAIQSLMTIATAFLGEGGLNEPLSQIGSDLLGKGKGIMDTGKEAVNTLKGTEPDIQLQPSVADAANNYIEGTGKTMNNVTKDPDFVPPQGENPVATVQKNIVDGISGAVQGVSPEAVKQISALDPSSFKSVDDFTKAATDIISNAHPEAAAGVEAGSGRGVLREPVKPRGMFDVAGDAKDLADRVKLTLAEKNVGPQLETSARRLSTSEAKNPVDVYNDFVNQEKKFSGGKGVKGDIKQDPALSSVGERIGDNFDKVVTQRRAVGAKMGTELKKVGGIKTDIAEPVQKFKQEMYDQMGMERDPKTGKIKLTQGAQSRLSTDDTKLLSTYENGLDTLGPNPTIKNLDAFISRANQEIVEYKGSKGITQTTNGERIIKSNLSALRDQFDPAKTGNPKLQDYFTARKTYSDLSDFLDEGVKYLGNSTQSGDYQKDASLAKSSVQSILNNGKKDWLVKLEGLTGYPALDESVLALQAMKDLGNFRGSSLLELIQGGDVPHSVGGVKEKILNWLSQKGAAAFTGSPEEQTRLFLQSLSQKK